MRGPARGVALAAALLALGSLASLQAAAAVPATVEVVTRELPQAFAAEGTVEAVKQAIVGAQATGRVVELAVKAGDSVRAGQLIARIDAREADQAVAASLSQVAEAEANLANAKRAYERNRELVAQKFVSQAALDQSEASYKAAQAQVAAQKAVAGQAATQRSFATVVAPFAGVVGATHVEAGDLATAGRQIATVFVPGDLRVTATLPQAALARWKRELPVAVELPVLNRTVTAVRATVVPIADTRTHTVKVRLDLPVAEGLLPGQFARARFPTGTVRALAVPSSALVRRGEVTAVYVLARDGRMLLRQVRTGDTLVDPRDGAVVEVLTGLSPGERIAANPIAAGLGAAP
jgi:RND family efflux transporter MFP subunit